MNESVGIGTALVAGFISFVSPCVLPVVPAYLSFVSGMSIDEIRTSGVDASRRRQVLLNCLAFVAGFSVVFIALGASASAVGVFLRQHMGILAKVAGVVIVLFGLNTLGLIRIPFLNYEKRFHQNRKASGLAGSFVVGLAFAFGWTPCIGPILGAILGMASTQERVGEGMVLLTAYSLGLGIPFLLAGLSVDRFFQLSSQVKKRFRVVEIVSGILLIAIGVMIFFNLLGWLSSGMTRLIPGLGSIG